MRPSWVSFDGAKTVDAGSQALRVARVPLHKDLELVGVRDGSLKANAGMRLKELDALAFSGYMRTSVLIKSGLAHRDRIGIALPLLDGPPDEGEVDVSGAC